MLAILIQALYGAVDLIVVGKFGSTASVAAVANGSQIMNTVTGVIIGLTTGVTVLVGTCVGARDEKGAAEAVAAMVKLFSCVALVITALMLIFAEDITRVMNVPEQAVEGTLTYLRVCSSGMVFICAFNAISGLFRGVGDSKSPLLFIAIACGVNIVLDLLFCGVFKLDVFGAALATVIAQAASAVFSLVKIKRGGLRFAVTARNLEKSGAVKKIVKIGLPIATQEFLVSISFLIIMAIINDISLVASASIGIAEKLFVFLAIIPMSFTSSLSAFVAQNVGARQEERALKALGMGTGISLVFGFCMTVLTFFGGGLLAGIFEKNPQVIAATAEYLRGVSFEYVLIPTIFCLLGYFNGTGNTAIVMLEGIVSAFLIRIPLSYFISRLPDTSLLKIALAVPAAALFSLILCVVYFMYLRKKRLGRGPSAKT
jgi:putative MATE family efflux protein